MFIKLFLMASLSYGQVIDAHTHVSKYLPNRSVEVHKKMLNENGITKAFVLSWGYMDPFKSVMIEENDYVAAYVKQHSDRLVGFCGIPLMNERALYEIERCYAIGLRGIKLHPLAIFAHLEVPIASNFRDPEHLKRLKSVLTSAKNLGMIVLIDTHLEDELATLNMLRTIMIVPEVKVILAHALGSSYREIGMLKYLLGGPNGTSPIKNNIYLELSDAMGMYRSHPEKQNWVEHLRYFGMSRVLFGSDGPGLSTSLALEMVKNDFGFTSEELNMILYKNAEALLATK